MASTDNFDETFSHHTTRANGVRLHYVMGGEGDPVVLLHGWTQTWRGWRKVMPLLAERHTVIAPDLRGMGDSDKPLEGYDGLTVAEDVRQLVLGLGFERFHLVGHDVGAWAAYPLAASHPGAVRTLALVDGLVPGLGFDELSVTKEMPLWHPAFHMAHDVAEMLVSGREREYLSYFYRTYSYDPAAIGGEDVDEYVSRYSAPGGLRGGFGYYRAFFEDLEQNRALAQRKLGMPVLALGGDHSIGDGVLWATREFADDVRGGAVERCGHFVPDERPRDLAERLLAFFDETANARGRQPRRDTAAGDGSGSDAGRGNRSVHGGVFREAFTPEKRRCPRGQRIGRLATTSAGSGPHMVPVNYPFNAELEDHLASGLVGPGRWVRGSRPEVAIFGFWVLRAASRTETYDPVGEVHMANEHKALSVSAVDYHTAGEPFRIVSGGVGQIPGTTVLDKRAWAIENLDRVRRLLVYEPRGHADMYGCFVTEPDDADGDLGVLFFHNAGFSTACGHGTIALATWAIESGVVAPEEPETRMTVDVPSGRLAVVARVEGGRPVSVRFRNVPSFVHSRGLCVVTRSAGEVVLDVSFGGAFYASVDARALGLAVEPGILGRFVELGREIKDHLNATVEISHPLEPRLRDVYGTIFFENTEGPAGEPGLAQRNVTVFADGEVDRSPCGSGTSARLALLHADGALATGETLDHAGIVGTRFEGRVVEETGVAGLPAVVTEVEGSANLTGHHQFVLERDDPLGPGFLLR